MPGASVLIHSHRHNSPTKQQNSNTLSPIESKALVREFKVCVYFLSTIPIWTMMKLISGLRVKLVIHIT